MAALKLRAWERTSCRPAHPTSTRRRRPTPAASLAGYQQHDRTGAHMIDIRFNPPLPPTDQLASEAQSAFQISLDDFRHLLAGDIRVRREGASVMMDWRFDEPAWARSRVLRTTALLSGDNISHLDLRPLKNQR